jgi:hypothetical protein
VRTNDAGVETRPNKETSVMMDEYGSEVVQSVEKSAVTWRTGRRLTCWHGRKSKLTKTGEGAMRGLLGDYVDAGAIANRGGNGETGSRQSKHDERGRDRRETVEIDKRGVGTPRQCETDTRARTSWEVLSF